MITRTKKELAMFGVKSIGRIGACFTAVFALVSLASRDARADDTSRSWNFLTTGNGLGFQVFDANQNKIVTFLDHPYRYLAAPPASNMYGEGPSRRNLAFDIYFGVRQGTTSTWLNAAAGTVEYFDQSNIIHASGSAAGTTADSYFFAPFGYSGNAMVGVVVAPGANTGFINLNFHMGNTNGDPDAPDATGEAVRASGTDAMVETGPGGGAMIYVALNGASHMQCNGGYDVFTGGQDLNGTTSCSGTDQAPAMEQTLDTAGAWAVAMEYTDDPTQADTIAANLRTWANGRAASKILSDAHDEFESWRVPPPAAVAAQMSADETKLWRQSEAVLRMGQIREVNTASRTNNGMILASLPPGQWHTGWVRDGTYATSTLARMGHYAEAKASLNFFMNTPAVGKNKPLIQFNSYVANADYRISVCRYFGSGEEEADFDGMDSPNVEIDGWGLMMWAARQYVQNSGDTAWLSTTTTTGATIYDTIKNGIAGPLQANLTPDGTHDVADSSIWEVHEDNKRTFAYSSIAAARGFCDMATLAFDQQQTADVATYKGIASTLKTGLISTFSDQNGALVGSLEENNGVERIDAAVIESFAFNLLPSYTSGTASSTLTLLNKLALPSGGFFRNNDGLSSYDDNEWILIDFRMSNAFRLAGNSAAADALLATLVNKAAANFYLLPELYNAVASEGTIGAYAGSIPMVGYGAGMYITTILDRAGIPVASDCGDGTTTTVVDGGVVVTNADGGVVQTTPAPVDGGTTSTGPGNMATTNASNIPYTPACLCDLVRRAPSGPGLFVLGLVPVAAAVRRRARNRKRLD